MSESETFVKLSIIIPTHNRSYSLKRTIESVIRLDDEADFELIVVDNNSTDNTRDIAESYPDIVKYVFEKNTSFTRARGTGAENSSGDIFLYLDDDVIVNDGALSEIISVFGEYPDCGLLAGKILPEYEEDPPDWTLACQKTFNGWSMFNPEVYEHLDIGFQKTPWAAGPMMAVRKKAYDSVGGFPPDTVGVETNLQTRMFKKLYIGPGDYGLCQKIREDGFHVYYSPGCSCRHVVLKMRLTVQFWRSRMIGEGHHHAVTNREFHQMGGFKLMKVRKSMSRYYSRWTRKLLKRLSENEGYLVNNHFNGMLFEELWVHYYKAYLDMDIVLKNHADLSGYLWKLALDGVTSEDYQRVIEELPEDYLKLIDVDKMYAEKPINSVKDMKQFGFC